MPHTFAAAALATLLASPNASTSPVPSPALAPLATIYPDLEALYIDLHQTPELSLHEEKTSAKLAGRLRVLGYDVTERVGGYGVVAVMKNGKGPTVLVRADMDALPVEEKTGLPYASKVRTKNDAGVEVPVMHACGHDVHMTSLIGAATLLAKAKGRWRGTLVLIAQPAEEGGHGAQNMLKDGLLTRFPKPDYAIALHDFPFLPAGQVSATPGYVMANVDSVDITIYGRGGHGSAPQYTVDPIVIAARTVLALQTIVSRENDPSDPAVVTVGSIHGGTKHNIIPDEVKLQLTVRSYKEIVRNRLLAAIARIAKAEAAAAGAPKEPLVVVDEGRGHATYNDPALTKRVAGAFARAFGQGNVTEVPPVMGAEDFGEIGAAAGIPYVLFWVGGADPQKIAAARGDMTRLPYLHSSEWAPDREPTLKTGTAALTVAALELLRRP
ncbi:MAG: amidohydrolase [Thermoanaerobaculia bacterium]